MEEETTVAQGLRVTSDREKLDASCKRLLSEKQILARIMKACLPEYKDCDVNDIAEKYIEGQPQVEDVPVMPDEDVPGMIEGMDTADKTVNENISTYDVRFYALVPGTGKQSIRLIINVEAQNEFNPGYPLTKRGIYYCCRMISAQYGRVFKDSHYEKIEKVYSIWICMNPTVEHRNTITRYRLVEEHLIGEANEEVQNYDLLSVVMICLGGPKADNYCGILRMLDVLFSSGNVEEKQRILQDDYGVQMTQTLKSEVSTLSGLWIGVEQKGRAEGILESIKNLMQNMGIPVEQAMNLLGIPDADQPKYISLLANQ